MTKSVESPTGRVESAGASARQGAVDRHLRRPTSSLQAPLTGPSHAARLEAEADLHRVASTAMRLLRGYYEATTRATTRLPRGLLQGYYL